MTNRTDAVSAKSASPQATEQNVVASDDQVKTADATAPGAETETAAEDKKPSNSARSSRSRTSRSNEDGNEDGIDQEQPEEGQIQADESKEDGEIDDLDADADGDADPDADADAEAQVENEAGGASAARRQRSSELAGLGLAHLGDGDDQVLAPRRSRRAAANEGDSIGQDDGPAPPLSAPAPAQEPHNDSTDTPAHIEPQPLVVDQPYYDPVTVAYEDGEEMADSEGVTRCICGSADEDIGLMIQCETCKCWQHCSCMGMLREEDCPDVYFCEQCRPQLHLALLRSLGVLPPPGPGKGGKKTVGGRATSKPLSVKDQAAKDLKEAREAVALLAQQNAQRRLDGSAPIVTGATNAPRRPGSESHDASAIAAPGAGSPNNDPYSAGRKSPKRRSTMNSRDSGWEPIPPGLLHDNEEVLNQDIGSLKREHDDDSAAATGLGRKRKRESKDSKYKRGEEASPSPAASPPVAGPSSLASGSSSDPTKRRRMSASSSAANLHNNSSKDSSTRSRRSASYDQQEEDSEGRLADAASASTSSNTASMGRKGKGVAGNGKGRAHTAASVALEEAAAANQGAIGNGKGRQPNQYTYRNGKERVAAANAANRTVSPTPSPSKSGRRGAAALREGSSLPSRTGSPSPANRNAAWGLPEHLSHLAEHLPGMTPEMLQTTQPTRRGGAAGRGGNSANDSASHTNGSNGLPSSRPSPHAYQSVELSEVPTKVRWPSRRITMTEMRKRIRNVSDFIGRSQVESAERSSRTETLGIEIELPHWQHPQMQNSGDTQNSGETTARAQTPVNGNKDEDTTMADGEANVASTETNANTASETTTNTTAATPTPALGTTTGLRESIMMMEDISKDIVDWLAKYGPSSSTSVATVAAQMMLNKNAVEGDEIAV
ncbi:unnamed protein product [Sympodiomycopsis kandeliae]